MRNILFLLLFVTAWVPVQADSLDRPAFLLGVDDKGCPVYAPPIGLPIPQGYPKAIWELRYARDYPAMLAAVQAGGNPNQFDPITQKTLTHLAALNVDDATLQKLIALGGDVNLPDKRTGATPLSDCVTLAKVDRVKFLVDHGASTTEKDKDGLTPSECARKYIQDSAKQKQIEELLHEAQAHSASVVGSKPTTNA